MTDKTVTVSLKDEELHTNNKELHTNNSIWPYKSEDEVTLDKEAKLPSPNVDDETGKTVQIHDLMVTDY